MRISRRRFCGAAAASAAMAAPVFGGGRADATEQARLAEGAAVEHLDARFTAIGPKNGAVVQQLATGFRFLEGPVWLAAEQSLLFSHIPRNEILRWSGVTGEVSVFRSPSGHANGLTLDREGRLLACEHSGRRVSRTEPDGTITTIAAEIGGKRLNSPNDLAVHPDGGIWFTDPDYGISSDFAGRKAVSEVPRRVYRWDPATGGIAVVADEPVYPNGIAFSPDYKTLYLTDSKQPPEPILAYDVVGNSRLARPRRLFDKAVAVTDGICVDRQGNIWASAGWTEPENYGVHVYSPDGEILGKIKLPDVCTNVCFGGRFQNRLFMTARRSLFALDVKSAGAPLP